VLAEKTAADLQFHLFGQYCDKVSASDPKRFVQVWNTLRDQDIVPKKLLEFANADGTMPPERNLSFDGARHSFFKAAYADLAAMDLFADLTPAVFPELFDPVPPNQWSGLVRNALMLVKYRGTLSVRMQALMKRGGARQPTDRTPRDAGTSACAFRKSAGPRQSEPPPSMTPLTS